MGGALHTPDVAEGNTVPGILSSLPEEQRNQRNVWDDRPFPCAIGLPGLQETQSSAGSLEAAAAGARGFTIE